MNEKTDKMTENGTYIGLNRPISFVQCFLLNNPGYFFTVKQIREKLEAEANITLNHKTVRSALREISLFLPGFEKKIDRAGTHNIHIHFYRYKKP
jgi:hypothetical protein